MDSPGLVSRDFLPRHIWDHGLPLLLPARTYGLSMACISVTTTGWFQLSRLAVPEVVALWPPEQPQSAAERDDPLRDSRTSPGVDGELSPAFVIDGAPDVARNRRIRIEPTAHDPEVILVNQID